VRTPPKAYTIEPPLETKTHYEPGESFSFGITLFGQATNLFPCLILAVPMMGEAGIGRRLEENRRRRGRFTLKLIEEINPLTGQRKVLKDATSFLIQAPENPVDHSQVLQMANAGSSSTVHQPSLTLRFLTPTRIIEGGHLVKQPLFTPLFHRLLERLEALSIAYGEGAPQWDKNALLALADEVRLVEDRTRWVDIKSFSSRLGRSTPTGGFVGEAVYEAEDPATTVTPAHPGHHHTWGRTQWKGAGGMNWRLGDERWGIEGRRNTLTCDFPNCQGTPKETPMNETRCPVI